MVHTVELRRAEVGEIEAPDPVLSVSASRSEAAQRLARRAQPHLLSLSIFIALTIIATWPMFPQLGGFVIDKRDPLYSVWAMAWQAHALATDPMGIFDTNILYP